MKYVQSPVNDLQRTKQIYENKLFKVSVPYISTLSSDELRMFGVYHSGDRHIDKTATTEMTNIMIPAREILEYFKEGATIRLPRADDIKDIYITIQNYLEAWKYTLEIGVNMAEVPSEDLLELDALATEVFGRARWYFNSVEAESAIARHLNQLNRVSVNNFFENTVINAIQDTTSSNHQGTTTINAIGEEAELERESLSDFFKRKVYDTRFRK